MPETCWTTRIAKAVPRHAPTISFHFRSPLIPRRRIPSLDVPPDRGAASMPILGWAALVRERDPGQVRARQRAVSPRYRPAHAVLQRPVRLAAARAASERLADHAGQRSPVRAGERGGGAIYRGA